MLQISKLAIAPLSFQDESLNIWRKHHPQAVQIEKTVQTYLKL